MEKGRRAREWGEMAFAVGEKFSGSF